MRELVAKLQFLLNYRSFLKLLFVINLLGTIYGYYWYKDQLENTDPIFYIFVPDSPTASLFFTIAVLGWLIGKNYKFIEALAVVTLVKYGIWAVVMNILTFIIKGELAFQGWMLVVSHGLMAVQALLYYGKYKFTFIHVAVAAIWTLHNDVIDYLFGQMPIYSVIYKYPSQIGYFTFWLSIVCIMIAYLFTKRRQYIA